ncbi:MAG: HipA domain-containing protein [Saprospiraceae bacterium]
MDIPIGGDAPKEIVQAYFYKKGEIRSKKWPVYIAKVGHKHYPIESITEHLLNKLGNFFGMEMADSELAYISYSNNKQIRFFSKYFLDQKREQLIHGADIYAGYLNDEEIIKLIEKQERDIIIVQEAKKAIEHLFPESPEILKQYIKLLLFDALIGNNDRHFYNWGCIKSLTNENIRFSPIYDTARGMFWNHSDEDILLWTNNNALKDQQLIKYINKSMPKIGWDGKKNLNHFDLVGLLFEHEIGLKKVEIITFFDDVALYNAIEFINNGPFTTLFIKERSILIIECLTLRFKKIKEIISVK